MFQSPSRRALSPRSPAEAWTPPHDAPASPTRPDPFRELIVGLDHWLSRRSGTLEFSSSPGCMLRVAPTFAQAAITLSDGVTVRRGDPILELHFWNERIPQASATRGLGWGNRFGHKLRRSFGELAVAVERDPRLTSAVAMRGRLSFAGARDRDDMRRFAHWFALETPPESPPPSLVGRLHDVGEDIWHFALSYAYNPGCLPGRQAVRVRDDLWMSRATLLARYGAGRHDRSGAGSLKP